MASLIKAHLELFNQIQYAHNAFKLCCEDGETDKSVFRYFQVTLPSMSDQVKVNYGEFSDALQQLAATFRCRALPCEAELRDRTLSPEIAFAFILNVVSRTTQHMDSDKQLRQMLAPCLAMTAIIKRWGQIHDDQPLNAPAFKEHSLLMARMAFRRQGHELDQFNEKKANTAIDRACQKILMSDEFIDLPQRIQYLFAQCKIKRAGYMQGLAQASNLALLQSHPDKRQYHELDPSNY